MKLGTSLRFLFPTSPATHDRFRSLLASMPKGAFIEPTVADRAAAIRQHLANLRTQSRSIASGNNLALQFQPVLGGLIAVALIFAAPWFIMRGLRFNARVTSYRNIRFDFTGKYGGGFLAYVLGVALIYGSGGILAPLASQWMWGYTLDNLRYADRPIKCEPRLEKLYRQDQAILH